MTPGRTWGWPRSEWTGGTLRIRMPSANTPMPITASRWPSWLVVRAGHIVRISLFYS